MSTTVTVDPVVALTFLNVLYHGIEDGWVTINWLLTKTGSSGDNERVDGARQVQQRMRRTHALPAATAAPSRRFSGASG
jgi:hypothetical protein